MFSLIITIISIALVAALALATIYYGGAAFNKSAASANAAKIANQAQQLMGAVQLYRADHGAWPDTMQDLVTNNYLKTVPVAQLQGLTATAHAAGEAWTMPTLGNPTFVLADAVDLSTCRETNRKLLGADGVLKQAYAAYRAQCYGSTPDNLTVVVTAEPLLLSSATLPGGAPLTTPPPVVPGTGGTGGEPGGEPGGETGGGESGAGDPWLVAPGTDPTPDGGGGTTPPDNGTVTPELFFYEGEGLLGSDHVVIAPSGNPKDAYMVSIYENGCSWSQQRFSADYPSYVYVKVPAGNSVQIVSITGSNGGSPLVEYAPGDYFSNDSNWSSGLVYPESWTGGAVTVSMSVRVNGGAPQTVSKTFNTYGAYVGSNCS